MNAARRLQQLALTLLWVQLLLHGQLQPLVLVALPLLLVVSLRQRRLPRPALLGLTALVLLLWASGASLGDRSALLQSACNLLWLLCGLKLLEARRHNDQRRCSLLLLLAVGLAGVGGQALAASLLQAASALLALASLLALEAGPQPLGQLLRRSTVLVGLALPVLVAAFVLLPRLEPLWSLQLGGQGRSGLSQRLAPGELARLVQDNGLAARVSFAGQPPPPAQRYWRVLVHQRFDGSSWSAAVEPSEPLPAQVAPSTTGPVLQRWLVEPSGLRQRPWDGQGEPTLASQLQLGSTGTLATTKPQQESSLYSLVANPAGGRWRQLAPTAADLQLPPVANPRLQALGRQWASQGSSAEARVNLAQTWFLQQGFRYTLEPGSLGSIDPLDGFLFETRAGFCEHFAASFSALMRAAGVPARVVVGYQGGSWQQPLGGEPYLQLRHSDAHAWSEVWLPPQGWVRVDPTGWVVPERLRRSLAASLNQADQQRLSPPPPGWLRAVADQWTGLDYRWQLWVMGFDRQRQLELLGNSRWQGLVALAAMAAALALGLVPLLWNLQRRGRGGADLARRQIDRLLKQLQQRGHSPAPGESLERFCLRVAELEPQWAQALNHLCSSYQQWRFDPKPPPGQLQALLASIRAVQLGLGRGHRPTA
jgi:transglutaminase-like putative cysteine protease